MENKGVVGTLELESGCYYVGWSKCFESLGFRLGHHFSGQGAAWTKLHTPCKVISVELGDKNLERETTLRLAEQHTWEKTRGAAWCQVNLKCRPGQLDSYTALILKTKQRTISQWISEAKNSISRADHHLSSLMDTVLTEGPPAEDGIAQAHDQDDVVLPRHYEASVP